jgi:hypothetical protein
MDIGVLKERRVTIEEMLIRSTYQETSISFWPKTNPVIILNI